MSKGQREISKSEISDRLQILMLLRVIFVSLLLGASVIIQIKRTQTFFGYIQTSHYVIIAIIYLLTFIYLIIYKYAKDLLWLAYLQLIVDTFIATAIIYTTGGIESIFSFLYILTIINGSIILYRRGGMSTASSSSILYGLLLDLHYYNIIKPLGSQSIYGTSYYSFHIFYLIIVNIVAFYLVAYLSSYLSEQARDSRVKLKAKQIDVDKLEILNESIINSITSGLVALDGQKKLILCNPAADKIFGIHAHEAIGQPIDRVLPFLNKYLPDETSPQNQADHTPYDDLIYEKPEGGKMHLRVSASRLALPLVQQEGFIIIFQNVTEMKRIEDELKRMEDLALTGELAAGIAHEIRNPMASISGSIQMLRNGTMTHDVSGRLMGIISREIDRLNHLVNDFLSFARPKKPNVQKFELNHLILESLELFKNSQHWTNRTKIETAFPRPIMIQSDPEQLKQVLWNLFLNACEAMPGGGTLRVATQETREKSKEDNEAGEILIRDTGKGFPDEALPRIFTPFFTTKEHGSGLGLATVKRIVEGLQGEVRGGNHPEGGAEIAIKLPVRAPNRLLSQKDSQNHGVGSIA